LLKTKLEKFIAKRSLIFFIILAILDIVLFKNRWYVLVGLVVGGVFSISKFGSYTLVFSRIIASESRNSQHNHPVRKSLIVFFINQLVLLPLLYFALKFNQWFFIGVVAGILLVPLVLFINSITETLKITHNNFE
jgi:hypothetical protein